MRKLSVNCSFRKVEALKRELTEEKDSRSILRDRIAEKGPAPNPPSRTREVDYVGFAK